MPNARGLCTLENLLKIVHSVDRPVNVLMGIADVSLTLA